MSKPEEIYDYVILGAGCAGLSLALHMVQAGIASDKSILLLEKDPKDQNDRTWCFWSSQPTIYDSIVEHSWSNLSVHTVHGSQALDISPYRYHKLRGIDFYNFAREELDKIANVHWQTCEVLSVEQSSLVTVHTSSGTYFARHAFSSYGELPDLQNHHLTLQHFGGWFIEAKSPVFDVSRATFMDFRVDQFAGETRFCYVLPTSSTKALVEVAIYSDAPWDTAAYDDIISNYIDQFTAVESYTVEEREYGVIPMTDYPLWSRDTDLLTHIGTAGGAVKPSTGYAFARIQRHSQQVTAHIGSNKPWSAYKTIFNSRFRYYDATLLDVLLQQQLDSAAIFHRFFARNSASDVLAFLNDESSFLTELKICSSMPMYPFAKGLLASL